MFFLKSKPRDVYAKLQTEYNPRRNLQNSLRVSKIRPLQNMTALFIIIFGIFHSQRMSAMLAYLYRAPLDFVNFGRRFWLPVALRRLEANLKSWRERAMRWKPKDVYQNSQKMTVCGTIPSTSIEGISIFFPEKLS